jgi:hypothetical protein
MHCAALVLAAGAEGLAIWGHVEASHQIPCTAAQCMANNDYNNVWHPLELSGHIVAGSLLAVGAGCLVAFALLSRSTAEAPAGPGSAAATTTKPMLSGGLLPGGGGLVLSGRF